MSGGEGRAEVRMADGVRNENRIVCGMANCDDLLFKNIFQI